jgi:signal transduction histidine kinase
MTSVITPSDGSEPTGPVAVLDSPEKRRVAAGIVVLTLIALTTNYFSFSLHFGLDFLFGSIFVLLGIWLFGPLCGVCMAAVASSYTYWLWGHPYAIIIFVSEALVVGLLLRTRNRNLVLLDGIYWFFIGIPLVWFIYRGPLGFDRSQAYLIVVKDAFNGIFNALVASLVISVLNAQGLSKPLSMRRVNRHKTPLSYTFFNLLVGCVLLPTIIFTVVNGDTTRGRLELDMRSDLSASSRIIANALQRWSNNHYNAVREIANYAREQQTMRPAALQENLTLVSRAFSNFHTLYVADANGRVLAAYPQRDSAGRPNVGKSHSARGYFKKLKQTKKEVVSGVFRGSGRGTPMVALNVPIIQNGVFRGYVSGGINLEYPDRVLRTSLPYQGVTATLVDGQRRVIASTRNSLQAGQTYDRRPQPNTVDRDGFYRWVPGGENLASVRRWRDAFLIRSVAYGRGLPWRLYIETPYALAQTQLEDVYSFNLTMALGLMFGALFAAALLGRALAGPLNNLALVTNNLPKQLLKRNSASRLLWPRSSIVEIDSLIKNFRTMEATLRNNMRDIQTARAELEIERTRLDEANRLKDDFLAVLSHELRTPLVPVLGYADLIARGALTGDDATDAARSIERNARTQLRLIEDLLDVSAIMSGKLRLELGVVDLPVLVGDAGEAIAPTAGTKNVEISYDLQENVPYFWGDATRVRQIVWNLLSNALKFTPEDGHINVSLHHFNGQVILTVKDDGIGIAPEFLPHVFDRFRQAGSHLTRPAGGLGLGLAIVRHLVDLHDGQIKAESDGEGHGTTMTVTLPLKSIPHDHHSMTLRQRMSPLKPSPR